MQRRSQTPQTFQKKNQKPYQHYKTDVSGKLLIYGSIATLKDQGRDLTQNYLCGK